MKMSLADICMDAVADEYVCFVEDITVAPRSVDLMFDQFHRLYSYTKGLEFALEQQKNKEV